MKPRLLLALIAAATVSAAGAAQTVPLGAEGVTVGGTNNMAITPRATGVNHITNLAITADQTWHVASGHTFKYQGESSGTTSTNPAATVNLNGKTVTVDGAGVVEIDSAHIFNGAFNVTSTSFSANLGNLTFAATGNVRDNLDADVSVTVGAGAAVRLHNGMGSSGSTFAQSTSLNGGTLAFTQSGGSFSLKGGITFGAGSTSIISNGLGSAIGTHVTLNGILSGAGNVNFVRAAGTGTTTLAATNTYTGTTAVSSGTVVVAPTGAIPVGAAGGISVSTGATLVVNGKLTLTDANASIANAGTITLGDASTLDLGTAFNGRTDGAAYRLFAGTGSVTGNFGSINFDKSVFSAVTFDNATGRLLFTLLGGSAAVTQDGDIQGGTGKWLIPALGGGALLAVVGLVVFLMRRPKPPVKKPVKPLPISRPPPPPRSSLPPPPGA